MHAYKEETKNLKTWLERLGYAQTTIKNYTNNLNYFFNWLSENKIDPENINQKALNKYNNHLHTKKIKSTTIQNRLNIIRLYGKYLQLTQNRKIIKQKLEAREIDLPKEKTILTITEIKKIYTETEETILGYRDKAILALYYGCGLRRSEGEKIETKDINYETGLLHIKPGKNHQNRYIPMSSGVIKNLKDYEKHSRPNLADIEEKSLIVNIKGKGMQGSSMSYRIKKLVLKARITKQITLHSLRHSIATHLLEGGMPLEQIAQFLGHKKLDILVLLEDVHKFYGNSLSIRRLFFTSSYPLGIALKFILI